MRKEYRVVLSIQPGHRFSRGKLSHAYKALRSEGGVRRPLRLLKEVKNGNKTNM